MQTAITDPSRAYLLISGGDGYQTQTVTGDQLEDAYLALHYGEGQPCPDDERADVLESLLDADQWSHNYPYGPVRYHEELEDGYIEAILLTPNSQSTTIDTISADYASGGVPWQERGLANVRTWQMDGWTEKDWDDITDADDDLRDVARELDNAVGGGGGGFEPAELAQFATRLQATADRLKSISGAYL